MSVHDELNNAKAEAEVWRTIACWSDVELAEELARLRKEHHIKDKIPATRREIIARMEVWFNLDDVIA